MQGGPGDPTAARERPLAPPPQISERSNTMATVSRSRSGRWRAAGAQLQSRAAMVPLSCALILLLGTAQPTAAQSNCAGLTFTSCLINIVSLAAAWLLAESDRPLLNSTAL